MTDEMKTFPGPSKSGKKKEMNPDDKQPGSSGLKKADLPATGAKYKITISALVCEAIEEIGLPRKGASAQAIKKYVRDKSEIEEKKLNTLINKALIAGLENNTFTRPSKSSTVTGAKGSFILMKEKPKTTKKRTKDVKENSSDEDEIFEKPIKATVPENPKNEGVPEKSKKATVPKKAKAEKVSKVKSSHSVERTEKVAKSEVKLTKVKRTKHPAARGDSSDSELILKKERKSMKSYASDSEVNLVTETKAKTTKKVKDTKSKGTKKLFNDAENTGKLETTKVTKRKTRA